VTVKKSAAAKKSAQKPRVEPFVISRTFNAPRPAVVKAWTDEKELMKWWGPKDGKMLSAKMDLRPGGMFHYSMQSTGFKMWGKWIIKEVDLPNRLVWLNSFSDPKGGTASHPMMPDFPKELHTTVTFTEHDGKTTVKVVWDPSGCSEAEQKAFDSIRESMQGGWGGSLDVLAEHLRSSQAGFSQMVTPYLTIPDAAKAIDYYKKVFGAEERMRMMAEDGKRIMHCALGLKGGTLLLSGAFPEHGGPSGPAKGTKSPVAVSLELQPPSQVDDIYNAAISSGSASEMAPADMFWGARFAAFTDPFGHRWMLNAMLPKH